VWQRCGDVGVFFISVQRVYIGQALVGSFDRSEYFSREPMIGRRTGLPTGVGSFYASSELPTRVKAVGRGGLVGRTTLLPTPGQKFRLCVGSSDKCEIASKR